MIGLRYWRLSAAAALLGLVGCATQLDWSLSPELYAPNSGDAVAVGLRASPRIDWPSPSLALSGGRRPQAIKAPPPATANASLPGASPSNPAGLDAAQFAALKSAPASPYKIERGKASWYSEEWAFKKTASGEEYNPYSYTAAHKSLPFGSLVRVKNLKNGREIYVRINNRGPFVKGRIIDLSPAAAQALEMYEDGVVSIEIQRVQ